MAASLAFSRRSVKSSVLEDGERTVDVTKLDMVLIFVVEVVDEVLLLLLLVVDDPPNLFAVPVNKGVEESVRPPPPDTLIESPYPALGPTGALPSLLGERRHEKQLPI